MGKGDPTNDDHTHYYKVNTFCKAARQQFPPGLTQNFPACHSKPFSQMSPLLYLFLAPEARARTPNGWEIYESDHRILARAFFSRPNLFFLFEVLLKTTTKKEKNPKQLF